MKLITLTQGYFAKVDDKNYEWLNQWKWRINKIRKYCYACSHTKGPHNLRKTILMHRLIMNTPKGMQVDHIDHDGLNCLEENMRNVTHGQNQMNRIPMGYSKYLGVTKHYKQYRASIQTNKIIYRIGCFSTEEEAARAYDIKAKELHGEFANFNFKG